MRLGSSTVSREPKDLLVSAETGKNMVPEEGDPELTEHREGPLEGTLGAHGGAIGLCFGFYAEAEASPKVHMLVADKWQEQESAGSFDFSGNQDQAKARMVRLIRKNLGLWRAGYMCINYS
mmetsp:Transcript_30978/g.90003  ORF Transcript_30978/g.90003 Transcript_30978/m.90003 type:complete len:121 (-) Transcript_30978:53-415(-)